MSRSVSTIHHVNGIEILVSLEGPAWAGFLISAAALGICILFQSGVLPTTRLTAAEARISFSRRRAMKRSARLRAIRLPQRDGPWNDLVDRFDSGRVRAQALAARRRRWILFFSLLVAGLLFVAVVAAIVREIYAVALTNEASVFVFVRVIGLTVAAAYGWMPIPLLAQWSLRRVQRNRMPLEWRLLAASSSVRWLVEPVQSKWGSHELPRRGAISAPKARQLLQRLEAELVESLCLPSKALPSDLAIWKTRVAPRLSRVIESKARLLDADGGEVEVKAIYGWMDEVVDVLVARRISRRSLRHAVVLAEVADGTAARKARAILELRFWPSAAAIFLLLAIVLLGSTALFAILSAAEPFLSENPRLLDAAGAVAGIGLTGMATYLASVALLRRGR